MPRPVKGCLLVANDAINYREVLHPMPDRSQADGRLDALAVPIGKGELACKKRYN